MDKDHEADRDDQPAAIEDGRPSSAEVSTERPTVEEIINMLASNNEFLKMKTINAQRKILMMNQNDQLINRLKEANDLIGPQALKTDRKIEEKLSNISENILMIANWIKPTGTPISPDTRLPLDQPENISAIAAASNSPKSNPSEENKRDAMHVDEETDLGAVSQQIEGNLSRKNYKFFKSRSQPVSEQDLQVSSYQQILSTCKVGILTISSSLQDAKEDLSTSNLSKPANPIARKPITRYKWLERAKNSKEEDRCLGNPKTGTINCSEPSSKSLDPEGVSTVSSFFGSSKEATTAEHQSKPANQPTEEIDDQIAHCEKCKRAKKPEEVCQNCEIKPAIGMVNIQSDSDRKSSDPKSPTGDQMSTDCSDISTVTASTAEENNPLRNSSRLNASALNSSEPNVSVLTSSELTVSASNAKKYEVDYLFVGTHRFLSRTFIRITNECLILNIASYKESINIDYRLIKCLHHCVGKTDTLSRHTYLKIDFLEEAVDAINEYISGRSESKQVGSFKFETVNSYEKCFVMKLKFIQSSEARELRENLRIFLLGRFKENISVPMYYDEQRDYCLRQRLAPNKRQKTSDSKIKHQEDIRDALPAHKSRSEAMQVDSVAIEGKTESDFSASHEDQCFVCGRVGKLMMCDWHDCPKSYHLKCLNLDKPPHGKWICPVHHCDVCGKKAVKFCDHCPASFCKDHQGKGEMKVLPNGELICNVHTIAYLNSVKRKCKP